MDARLYTARTCALIVMDAYDNFHLDLVRALERFTNYDQLHEEAGFGTNTW